MAEIIDGRALATNIKAQVAQTIQQIKAQGGTVRFAAILVGDDPASKIYVRNKQKACEKVGIDFILHALPATCAQGEITALIQKLSRDPAVNGILLQLPLPLTVVGRDEDAAINAIASQKDVDGLTVLNTGRLCAGRTPLAPCTAQGVVHAIKAVCPDLTGKNVVIIGRSRIVGRPTSLLLSHENATVTVCHRHTKNLAAHTQAADIVVVAAGQPGLLTAAMVKPGAIVIDVGINRLADGSLCGDADFNALKDKVAALTPVPGGIGPLTIAFLLSNIVTAYQLQHGL